jgi:hypothetical protein
LCIAGNTFCIHQFPQKIFSRVDDKSYSIYMEFTFAQSCLKVNLEISNFDYQSFIFFKLIDYCFKSANYVLIYLNNSILVKLKMQQDSLNLIKFQKNFSTEKACQKHLFRLHWPTVFECPRCGNRKASFIRTRRFYQCCSCRYQTSLTAGTFFTRPGRR